jgi:hypothetical protein
MRAQFPDSLILPGLSDRTRDPRLGSMLAAADIGVVLGRIWVPAASCDR